MKDSNKPDKDDMATAENDNPVYRINTAPSQALVIHCGDPRFQNAFRSFVTEDLGIKSYSPMIIGGGVHALSAQSFMPENFKIARQQMKFFIKIQNLKQVIIINHQDCIWYEKMSGYHPDVDHLLKGKRDLTLVSRLILSDYTDVTVRSFWAALDGDTVVFEEVTDSDGT